MPWKETCVMDCKIQLISDYLSNQYSITDLSRIYCVSRKTVYKWITRYQDNGIDGLHNHSRAPNNNPHAVPDDVIKEIVKTKMRFKKWGPKKVMDYLRREFPDQYWPVDSTAGEILKKAGLVHKRRKRQRVPAYPIPLTSINESNKCWSADFKGDFLMRNHKRCYPLTITDNYSRYLLACRGLTSTCYLDSKDWFENVFREYGLPEIIRTDNGTPFASRSVGGISRLSKWWIDLGIRPERIKPGRPMENGKHERMHKSLKEAVCIEPGLHMDMQQKYFDSYIHEYNELRSHEGIGRKTPASVYNSSLRLYPEKIRPVEYEEGDVTRNVRHNGEIKFKGKTAYISELLIKETIALDQIDEKKWKIRYSFFELGILNEETMKVESCRKWHALK